jgi:hypothetical protein
MLTDSNEQLSAVLGQLKQRVEQLLVLLSEKERFVVERRFSLNMDRRFTLEEIGQQFNVTRERVRQIEKNALQKLKRNVENYDVITINNMAFDVLKQNGGIMAEDMLISRLISADVQSGIVEIQFIMSLDKRFNRIPNTINYRPYVRMSQHQDAFIEEICTKSLSYLRTKGELEKVSQIAGEIGKLVPGAAGLDDIFYTSLFGINKSFKVVKDTVGLMEWRHINPRTLRDKIFYVLRQKRSPMHFIEIGNSIVSSNFDRKGLNMQAVHNELIRHKDFVLIGRGIYALKEWGYSHGTVAEVIESILKGKESLSEEEIIAEVLNKRQVKPITIILNLKNKNQFTRVGRKQYAVKKA